MALTATQTTLLSSLTAAKAKLADQSDAAGVEYGDFAQVLESAAASLTLITTGQTTMLSSASTVVVTVDSKFNGKPIFAILGVTDGTKSIISAEWTAATQFTITASAAVSANRTVFYLIDGR
jgi:hypothetical protein